MAKGLMICTNASKSLKKLNEAASANKKYILEGVFAELDTLNRNQRIYTKDEYLKHLKYLRDDIKKGEALLGELDHPDDRFEVKLKEASHKIVDLWYDENENKVMGKIELLNTPNGKLAQSLVDQGIPLHISSRAAGTVNNDNTVSIQQIYTYDLVCKPGFAGAVLHTVNESAGAKTYTKEVNDFLTESNRIESLNSAPLYGFINENVSVMDVNAEAVLRNEAKNIQSDMNTDIIKTDEALEAAVAPVANEADDFFANFDDDREDKKEDGDAEAAEEDDKKESDIEIINVRAMNAAGEIIEPEASDEADEEASDEEAENAEDAKDDAPEKEAAEANEDVDAGDVDECGETEAECADDDKEKEKLFDCSGIENKKNKIDELIAAIKTKNECSKTSKNESLVMAQYPTSICLNESNFAEFVSLSESQKGKVIDYLRDNEITDAKRINECWKNGVDYVAAEPMWLKFAPAYYRGLYESASDSVKESIRYTADFVVFENQNDVNVFWENTGLAERSQRTVLNEQFVNNMPKIANPVAESQLPYGTDYINMIANMACEYDR